MAVLRYQRACCVVLMSFLAACGGGGGADSAGAVAGDGSGNSAPTISGHPTSTVQAGQAYSFQPSASDPDGSRLQFSVQNLPTWTTFDTSSGRISGTPTAAAIGRYEGIVVTVSDGSRSAQIGPFAIEVLSVGTGVATISWTPPTTNTDGSTLRDLSGYVVLYGRSADELSNSVSIDNPSISTYVVEGLVTGNWYFAVVATSSQGAWSPLSNLATKTIS